jgi:two-component system NtrC family response regulator
MSQKIILVVDDDKNLCRIIEHNLAREGYKVLVTYNAKSALDILKKNSVHLVLSDIQMPKIGGLELLARIKKLFPDILVIMITAYGSIETAVEAMKKGAYDYLTKPVDRAQLSVVAKKALEYQNVKDENIWLHKELQARFSVDNIIGQSRKIKEVFKLIKQVSQSDAPVLIQGESGTGKELVARAIHFNSSRKNKKFVTVNCPSIPENLIESELFGHVKGAFTGALKDKSGKFDLAHQGTIFLDEIGDLKKNLQGKLLRVLQEKEFERVGENQPIKIDVRVVSATNRSLKDEVEKGRFREDLFYRINVIPIKLPPLRERKEDISFLIKHFLDKLSSPYCEIDKKVIVVLKKYNWPGNVRELENIIERMLILRKDKKKITLEDLPKHILDDNSKFSVSFVKSEMNLEKKEKMLLQKALKKANNNQTKAAEILGISRPTLIYRMKKYGIK